LQPVLVTDREIIDFVDGDASRSPGSAGAGEQGNFLENGESVTFEPLPNRRHIESEVARARKDVERAARRAGIGSGHGNGNVDFAAAHKGELPRVDEAKGTHPAYLGAGIEACRNLHGSDGRRRPRPA